MRRRDSTVAKMSARWSTDSGDENCSGAMYPRVPATVVPSSGAFQLQALQTFRTDDGSHAPQSVAVADLDGDGKPELVTAWNDGGITGNNLRVLRGNGNGTFQGLQTYGGFGGDDHGPEAVVANLNGKPDIVFTRGPNVGVMLNIGNGTFANPVYYDGARSVNDSFEHPRIAVAIPIAMRWRSAATPNTAPST